jgi:hypothetical protein
VKNEICPKFGCGSYVEQKTVRGKKHLCCQYVSKWEYKFLGRGLFQKKTFVQLKTKNGELIKCKRCLEAEERIK